MKTVAALASAEAFVRARAQLVRMDEETLARQKCLSSIPAPTGAEGERARAVGQEMRRIGLSDVATDEVGNVTGWLHAGGAAPPVVAAAHLDTVFGPEVDVSVRRSGNLLTGAGIADNARGLAGMLAIAEVLSAGRWALDRPIAFVATVGEEGAGNLRGMRHLLGNEGVRPTAVLVLDGAGDDRVVHTALGTRRFRVIFRGPGGHSWAAFGTPNPAHAAGALAHAVADISRPGGARTACSVVGLSGGSGLNCIPQEARIDIDLRSEDPSAVAALETELRARARHAVVEENARRTQHHPPLTMTFEVIGDRPSGRTAEDDPLVIAAIEATRAIGRHPSLATASTDANIPMAMGIPAIALGAGGRAGEPHRMTEWFENADGASGLYRALLVLSAAAGAA